MVVTKRDAEGNLIGTYCTECAWDIKGKAKHVYRQMDHRCKVPSNTTITKESAIALQKELASIQSHLNSFAAPSAVVEFLRDDVPALLKSYLTLLAGNEALRGGLEVAIKVGDRHREERDQARHKINNLRGEVGSLRDTLKHRKLALDALHYVWCSGGCDGGVHQYSDEPLTAEIVAEAVRNTERLVQWYINHAGSQLDKPSPMEKYQKAWGTARKRICEALWGKEEGVPGPMPDASAEERKPGEPRVTLRDPHSKGDLPV